MVVLHVLAVRARDHAELARVVQQSRSLGTWQFMPASLVVLATGIWLVAAEAAFDFTDLWILIGSAGS